MELILASTSPYRRALLERLGIPFTAIAPDCDEEALKDSGLQPLEVARELARRKAASISSQSPHAAVVGSDQVLDLDGELLGKAGSAEAAVRQLQRLTGRSHRLVTAVAVASPVGWFVWENTSVLTMRSLTQEALHRYVSDDRPWDCAGSYKLEYRGIALFERIDTDDQTAIIGLPLLRLTQVLTELGFEIP
jgi:septum formation protein